MGQTGRKKGYDWTMETFVAAFVFFLVAVAAMAVGVMFQGKSLSGSCGGQIAGRYGGWGLPV